MSQETLPDWVVRLDENDLQLIRRFVLASGSLKQLAADYEVSYPTIRQRVDALIERLKLIDASRNDDALEAKLRLLVASGKVEPAIGRELLRLHRQTKGEKK